MMKLFCIFGLIVISLSASASSEWLFYKHYPWVYDNVSKDWLYLKGSSNGEMYAYRSSTKNWELFEVSEDNWSLKYNEWLENPEQYGGLTTLVKIKEAKDNMSTILDLSGEYGNSTNITDLTPLARLTNLTKLILFNNYEIQNIEPLETLVNLIELNLTGNKIDDISSIGNLTKLENLQLQDNRISNEDISIFAMLPNLKILNLEENEITDYSPLATLTDLTDLRLGQMTMSASQKAMLEEALPNTNITWPNEIIDDLQETEKTWEEKYEEWILDPEPYGGMEALQQIKEAKESGATELNLNGKNISDISPLYVLVDLTELQLSGNNISDLSPIAGLKNINELALHHNYIEDLSPIADLTDLTYLQLGNNNISDITPLASLVDVRWLYLGDNNISDITILENMSDMRELNLGNNNISNINPLANLINIGLPKHYGGYSGLLNLSYNNISDISALSGLSNSTGIELYGNNISDAQKAMLEEALPNTAISW